jgi:hypothetical protein
MFRTLRAHVSPRAVLKINHEHTIATLTNLFDQLELMLQLPESLSAIMSRLEKLANMPLNALAKCYFLSNMLNEQVILMHTVMNDISEWTGVKESITKTESFEKFIKLVSPFFMELMLKFLSNKPRCYR